MPVRSRKHHCMIAALMACLMMLTACHDREALAERAFYRAIDEWEMGHHEKAVELLDRLVDKYSNTQVATEARLFKAARLEAYQKANSPDSQRPDRYVPVLSDVIAALDAYYQTHGVFPPNLKALEDPAYGLTMDHHFTRKCLYTRAAFNYGYQLDCHSGIIAYRRHQTQQQSAKPTQYSRANPDLGSAPGPTASPPPAKKAELTWGKYLNTSGEAPLDAFLAVYINTDNPTEVIAREVVRDIAINYAWDKFHGIRSENFGAYWVGRIKTETATFRQIAISQSHAKTRLTINGLVIYEGHDNKELIHEFEPGEHLIEVEYINNWHTTGFKLTLSEDLPRVPPSVIASLLSKEEKRGASLHFAALYESDSRDSSVVLNIQKSRQPIVLMLSSYNPVKWLVINPHQVEIRAVIFGSHNPGSEVTGIERDETRLLQFKGYVGSYDTTPRCSCLGSHFHCEGSHLLNTKQQVESVVGMPLTGFSGSYSAPSLLVPELLLTPARLQEITASVQDVEIQRASCRRKISPDFETFFTDDRS